MKYWCGAIFFFICCSNGYGQVKYANGLIIDQATYLKVPKKASLIRGDYEKLPPSVSLKSYCPRPGNQIQLNTSPSWAVAYGAMTILEAETNQLTDWHQITDKSFSPVFNYALATNFNNKGCTVPVSLRDILESLKKYGVPHYLNFERFCPDSIPEEAFTLAAENKIQDYARLFDPLDAPMFKLEAVKKSLVEGLPVIIGMYCPPSFSLAKDFWQPREKVSDQFKAQALCVIGYDDSKYGGAFEVLNSWGNYWGNDGFMWIRYSDFLDYVKTAYEMFLIDSDRGRIDFSGDISLITSDGNPMTISLTNEEGYYQTKNIYHAGTRFKIYVTNNESAYVYVFGTDETNSFFPLFPYNDNISPMLNYKNSRIALPSENYDIEITGKPGKDFLIILYSKEEIYLNNIINKLQSLNGRIDDRIKNVLDGSIVDSKNIQWDSDEIKFSGTGNGKTIIPVYVEIQHQLSGYSRNSY